MRSLFRVLVMGAAATLLFAGCEKENKPVPEEENHYLFFEAVEEGATVALEMNGQGEGPSLEYSTDRQNWTAYDFRNPETITLSNIGDKVFWRNTGRTESFSVIGEYYLRFDLGARKITAGGNVMSLIDKSCQSQEITSDACFECLFMSDSTLVSAPELPATKLSRGCYFRMFSYCTALEKAPDLPAKELKDSCYYYMFNDCKALKKAPEINAEKLAEGCCEGMFRYCQSLEKAPGLPATELARNCYARMFESSSVKKASALPATSLKERCYDSMFIFCPELQQPQTHQSGTRGLGRRNSNSILGLRCCLRRHIRSPGKT